MCKGTACIAEKRHVIDTVVTVNIAEHQALDHFDETGTRMDKKLWWVNDASNSNYTYLDINAKRGFAGMEQCGMLPPFHGIAIHDFRASCWNYPNALHAVCCAHLLQKLTGIIENHPGQK